VEAFVVSTVSPWFLCFGQFAIADRNEGQLHPITDQPDAAFSKRDISRNKYGHNYADLKKSRNGSRFCRLTPHSLSRQFGIGSGPRRLRYRYVTGHITGTVIKSPEVTKFIFTVGCRVVIGSSLVSTTCSHPLLVYWIPVIIVQNDNMFSFSLMLANN